MTSDITTDPHPAAAHGPTDAVGAPELERNLISRVNVGDMLTRTAARHPDNEAIVEGSRRYTYRDLDDRVNQLANGLLERGYRRGDRLGLVSGNTAEFLMTYYACAKLGVGCVPVNLGWRAHEAAYVLGHSRARGVVVVGDQLDYLAEVLGHPDSAGVGEVIVGGADAEAAARVCGGRDVVGFDAVAGSSSVPAVIVEDRDPLQYLYTSGTTARPKGAVGSHLAIYLNSLGLCVDWEFRPGDRIVSMMPLFHTAQLNLFSTPAIAVGATILLEPGFDSERILSLIEDERGTVIFALPMMYRQMLATPGVDKRALASLRLAVYGMAPMSDEQLRQAMKIFGCDFSLMFGQTEMGPVTTIFRPEHQLTHPGSVGTPSINTQVAIMNGAGELLGTGQSGEIVYRSPQVMNEYLENPAATADAFRFGWFHSGDIGHFDDDGLLWFEDRSKDIIKTGGENVASIEVEKAIYAISPDITQIAVVGLPHEHWSEAITAFVVLRSGATLSEQQILVEARTRLDGFKAPKRVVLVEDLPMTSTGKIQKNVLRESHASLYQ